MRAVFLGNDPWSVPTLETLAADDEIEVPLVVTNIPKPAGRGSRITPTDVALAARRLDLPLVEVERASDALPAIREARPDVLVVVAYGEILTAELLHLAPLGAVNLHFSLLPRWRGAAPVQHAILAGDTETGVSVMTMDEGLDTGPVMATGIEPIGSDDDAGSLGDRLAARGASLLALTLRIRAGGSLEGLLQDEAGATRAPKLGPGERRIDWNEPADAIVRRVRALAPEPGATTTFRGAGLKIRRAKSGSGADAPGPPGTIAAPGDDVVVAAGHGTVRLLDVVPAGRAAMPAADWARGARPAGERLE